MINVDWSVLKSFADDRGLSLQYIDLGDDYLIIGVDGAFQLSCRLPKADATEFESSYKANGNKRPTMALSPFPEAETFRARYVGISQLCTANSTTTIDYLVSEERHITGAMAFAKSAAYGDYLDFEIVDKDNIFGYGANTVLDTFASNWYVSGDIPVNVQAPFRARIYAGLYIRIKYHSIDLSVAPTIYLNLYLYKRT